MEFIYILFFIAIIIMIIVNKNTLTENIGRLEQRIFEVQRLLEREALDRKTAESHKTTEDVKVIAVEKPTEEAIVPIVAETIFRAEEEIKPEKTVEKEAVLPEQNVVLPDLALPEKVIEVREAIIDESAIAESSIINRPVKTSGDSWKQYPAPKAGSTPKLAHVSAEPELSFFEKHPDLEKFIGENLINKIGIAILVLAIGYFVKFAIDNDWVGPAGRVAIGILCGGILVGIAHRMRNSYKAFSSVLVGGGLAIFYFTITLAYHQFHLFDQATSFAILIVITCFAVALSLLYDKQEVAVIALIGGLSSPFMVSSGHANYNALFIYMIILNTGLLIIAYKKSWRILNISAFVLTIIICALVLFSLSKDTYATGFCYIGVLYLLFFAINVANNLSENKKFIASDFSILLSNTALFFGAGLYLLTAMQMEQFRGLFSASLAIVNLILSWLLFKNKKVDTNILYLFIGITLTFISLTAPIQLNGHYITLFWAAETVLLYWLFRKSGIILMELISSIIFVAMIISLVLDWSYIYKSSDLTLNIIVNKGFITTIVAAISSYLLYKLMEKNDPENMSNYKAVNQVYKYIALILLFISGLLEINHQFLNRYPDTQLNSLYLILYVPVLAYLLFKAAKKYPVVQVRWEVSALLLSLSIATYLLVIPAIFHLQYQMVTLGKPSTVHFAAHWLSALFVGLSFYELIMVAKNKLPEEFGKMASLILSSVIVLFLSLEVSLAANLLFYSPTNSLPHIETLYIKSGLPVLWGLSSFALMWLGMRHKVRTLRIISLTLFSITLLKLFLFDIRNIPAAGKIAAFFCLGILLLIISFMYQKVKKIIVDEGAAKAEDDIKTGEGIKNEDDSPVEDDSQVEEQNKVDDGTSTEYGTDNKGESKGDDEINGDDEIKK